jgi:hypothetical protein
MEKIHQQNHPEVLISAGDTDWHGWVYGGQKKIK